MSQHAIDVAKPYDDAPSKVTRPSLGLRGGLGKTLLIAFLLLAIVPLGLLAFVTYNQVRDSTEQNVRTSLSTLVTLKDAQLESWVVDHEHELALIASDLRGIGAGEKQELDEQLAPHLAAGHFLSLALLNTHSGEIEAEVPGTLSNPRYVLTATDATPRLAIALDPSLDPAPTIIVQHNWPGHRLVGLLDWQSLANIIAATDGFNAQVSLQLFTEDGLILTEEKMAALSGGEPKALPEGVRHAFSEQSGSGKYVDSEGVTVYGAYHWNPSLRVGLLAELPRIEALAAGDTVTAMVVMATLFMALLTAAIAAVVTRRLTVPIVQLTETASRMARGDLDQVVPVERRDELGILARAFNRMAAELRVLYNQLEARVAERTHQLEVANKQTRHHAMQLAISAEVARVATSIRDEATLLSTAVDLIGRAFELYRVSAFLLDDSDQAVCWAAWQFPEGSDTLRSEQIAVGSRTLVGRVASDGRRRVLRANDPAAERIPGSKVTPPVSCQLAVSLQVQRQVLGVLELQSTQPGDFSENDQIVYQSLADQLSVAIENARAYAQERETVKRLRDLDRIQAQFLSNMSHALRTPLNSVIGFSRVMLKEIDGPLTDVQRSDLHTIHQSGRQLLGLITDMLELSNLELGTAPICWSSVNLTEIAEGVLATGYALSRGKPVHLSADIEPSVPPIITDSQRLRQVILALVANAIKFTESGSVDLDINLESNSNRENAFPEDQIILSVICQGEMSISSEDMEQLISDVPYEPDLPGFGLAISKRLVAQLGGTISAQVIPGTSSAWRVTLPLEPVEPRQKRTNLRDTCAEVDHD